MQDFIAHFLVGYQVGRRVTDVETEVVDTVLLSAESLSDAEAKATELKEAVFAQNPSLEELGVELDNVGFEVLPLSDYLEGLKTRTKILEDHLA